jgi:hypothetical protein
MDLERYRASGVESAGPAPNARKLQQVSIAQPIVYASLLAATVAGVGCKYRPRPGDLNDSAFVAVMAELRRAVQPGGAETTRDSAGRQAVRDSILRKYHATATALESTASHLADRPAHADEILQAIDRKVLALAQAAPSRPVQPPPPPAVPPGTRPPPLIPVRPRTPLVPQSKQPVPTNPPRT